MKNSPFWTGGAGGQIFPAFVQRRTAPASAEGRKSADTRPALQRSRLLVLLVLVIAVLQVRT